MFNVLRRPESCNSVLRPFTLRQVTHMTAVLKCLKIKVFPLTCLLIAHVFSHPGPRSRLRQTARKQGGMEVEIPEN